MQLHRDLKMDISYHVHTAVNTPPQFNGRLAKIYLAAAEVEIQ